MLIIYVILFTIYFLKTFVVSQKGNLIEGKCFSIVCIYLQTRSYFLFVSSDIVEYFTHMKEHWGGHIEEFVMSRFLCIMSFSLKKIWLHFYGCHKAWCVLFVDEIKLQQRYHCQYCRRMHAAVFWQIIQIRKYEHNRIWMLITRCYLALMPSNCWVLIIFYFLVKNFS